MKKKLADKKAYQREWYLDNREALCEKQRAYYAKNRKKIIARVLANRAKKQNEAAKGKGP